MFTGDVNHDTRTALWWQMSHHILDIPVAESQPRSPKSQDTNLAHRYVYIYRDANQINLAKGCFITISTHEVMDGGWCLTSNVTCPRHVQVCIYYICLGHVGNYRSTCTFVGGKYRSTCTFVGGNYRSTCTFV